MTITPRFRLLGLDASSITLLSIVCAMQHPSAGTVRTFPSNLPIEPSIEPSHRTFHRTLYRTLASGCYDSGGRFLGVAATDVRLPDIMKVVRRYGYLDVYIVMVWPRPVIYIALARLGLPRWLYSYRLHRYGPFRYGAGAATSMAI